MSRILFVITEDWALITHRLHLVKQAVDRGFEVGVVTRVTNHGATLRALGVTVFEWCLARGSLNLIRELRAIHELNQIIKAYKPDLIHAVALKPAIYVGLTPSSKSVGAVASALGGVGYIFSANTLKSRLLRPVIVRLLRYALRKKGRSLILQNEDDISLFKSFGISDRKISLLRGAGVELEIFQFSKESSACIVVTLPARTLWDKGVGEFVRIAERIGRKRPAVHFQLVGDPDLDNPNCVPVAILKGWVDQGVVEHKMSVPHKDMPKIFRESTIVCLPSTREGLPKSLLEAASTGRALVAYDVPGCREIVKHGQTGILVPFGDEHALERALLDLIDNPARRKSLGENARALVESEFSSIIINDQTFAIWKELSG